MKIILASSSLRRKMLLKSMGLKFECMIPQKEEDMTQKISIQKLSEKNVLFNNQEPPKIIMAKLKNNAGIIGSVIEYKD